MGKSVQQSRFLFGVFLNYTVSSSLLAVVLAMVAVGTLCSM